MTDFKTTPIQIRHIKLFQDQLGINATQMAWLLGASSARWSSISRDRRLAPNTYAEIRHALILRWIMQHQSVTLSLQSPKAGDFFTRLREAIADLTAQQFSCNLGYDASAGSRWQRCGAAIGPAGRRALSLLDSADESRLVENWREWSGNAATEARLRGVDLNSPSGWKTWKMTMEVVA
jgi:hypothetical protein